MEGQLGLEKTFEEHIEKLVVGFRELRRILRDDGIFFLNYGSKYLEDGNDSLIAHRLAIRLQEDGWILRSPIIWAKAVSFNDKYSGSTMPESVNGTRWERCQKRKWKEAGNNPNLRRDRQQGRNFGEAEIKDCPGCPKCEKNGGYVLRRGSWRCTRAHEYLFQFVKQIPYYCDMDAVKEDIVTEPAKLKARVEAGWQNKIEGQATVDNTWKTSYEPSGRNLRDVWTINPQPYPDSHYATFSEALVEPCIRVATSEKGCCPACGAPWARILDTKQIKRKRPADRTDRHNQEGMNSCGNTVAGVETTTIGWLPTCECNAGDPVPCVVFDPFMGSCTVAAVAARLGRNYIGSELNEDYIKKQGEKRIYQAETGLTKQEIENGQKALFE